MSRTMLRNGLLGIAFALIAAGAGAQEHAPPTVAITYELDVKPGHASQFESALKEQLSWYRQNDETWTWDAWEIMTGDSVGNYFFRSGNHQLGDFDERGERGRRARTHFNDVVAKHLDGMSSNITMFLDNLAHPPQDMDGIKMVTLVQMHLHPGTDEKFHEAMKQIRDAIEESGWPGHYWLGAMMSGGPSPTYTIVLPHKSFATMLGPEKPFWEMLRETLGEKDAGALRSTLNECIKEESTLLAAHRPDLSYRPDDAGSRR